MPKKLPPPTLAQALRSRREALGLRCEDVASRAGLALRSVYNYEKGTRSPSVDTLRRLAEALQCSPADLL